MIDRLPVFLGLAYFSTLALFGGSAGIEIGERFAPAFEAALQYQRLLLLPTAVATSIVTTLALLRHMNVSSGRGRLQILALLALLGSGALWATVGEPAADAMLVAARANDTAAFSLAAREWQAFRLGSLTIALVVVASLFTAQRMPLVLASGGIFAALTPRHRTILFLLGAATLFEGYDRFIVSLALPYIGDDLGAGEGTLGWALSLIRLGALASIFLGRLADRHGRRKLLLFTILAYTLATAATGLSRSVPEFVLFQLLATIFLVTELSLAQVVITEEFPTEFRATGQGFLGAFAALGAGLAAILFPIFLETRLGWRGLYFLGILPLLLIAWLRRALPETERWQQARADGETEHVALRDFFSPGLRARFALLTVTSMSTTAILGPAFAFASWRATKTFGWTPAQVSTLIVIGGGFGLTGWFVFGFLAERIGRRAVGMLSGVGIGIASITFYQGTWLFPAFGLLVFMEAGCQIALNALGTELFPTRLRSTAKAWITNAWIVGAMLGFGIVGALSGPFGDVAAIITALSILPMLGSLLLILLPEPRGLSLEEISADRAAASPR